MGVGESARLDRACKVERLVVDEGGREGGREGQVSVEEEERK